MKNIRELASETIHIQMMVHIWKVAEGIPQVMRVLRAIFPERKTTELYQHPIVVLWVARMADMCGLEYTWPEGYMRLVEDMAAGKHDGDVWR